MGVCDEGGSRERNVTGKDEGEEGNLARRSPEGMSGREEIRDGRDVRRADLSRSGREGCPCWRSDLSWRRPRRSYRAGGCRRNEPYKLVAASAEGLAQRLHRLRGFLGQGRARERDRGAGSGVGRACCEPSADTWRRPMRL
ncbi:hypothetical protein EXIGLDRAFT_314360 [Exidia glandulosa HHB12029]|uniref:Uncharacterized protein n=1 Tax=Exidia glandulosa HHB12029 TaxID=1314781 RepID=A0A165CYD5_EXIGL|nr:hypothetical protein EXIGLDRAFT_314360 [Exidia glandulosa HHB12029]